MKTLAELYDHLRALSAMGGFIDRADAQEFAATVHDAMRTMGLTPELDAQAAMASRPGQPRATWPEVSEVLIRLRRIESAFRGEDGEWASEPWKAMCERVSEGAQRDAADLHRRLALVEKRLVPPNPDGSWALLTTPEATTAIERLETEFAEFRKHEGTHADDHRLLWQTVHKAERGADEANARTKTLAEKVRGYEHQVKLLQQQFQNLRNKLKALLS